MSPNITTLVSSDGIGGYSAVATFMRKTNIGSTTYRLIKTSLNKTISLTGDHLIYVRAPGSEKFKAM